MIIKVFQAKNVLSVKQSFFLLYGENEGYKNQITENIVKEFGKTIIKYDADDIINNPDIIFTELNNLSLFENKKIIIVNRTTDKLFSIVENLLDTNYDDTKIIFNVKFNIITVFPLNTQKYFFASINKNIEVRNPLPKLILKLAACFMRSRLYYDLSKRHMATLVKQSLK